MRPTTPIFLLEGQDLFTSKRSRPSMTELLRCLDRWKHRPAAAFGTRIALFLNELGHLLPFNFFLFFLFRFYLPAEGKFSKAFLPPPAKETKNFSSLYVTSKAACESDGSDYFLYLCCCDFESVYFLGRLSI